MPRGGLHQPSDLHSMVSNFRIKLIWPSLDHPFPFPCRNAHLAKALEHGGKDEGVRTERHISADMTAAYLDYRDTGELARGVGRGEAPPPTGYHGSGRAREPVWSKAAIDSFATSRSVINPDGTKEQDLASLV
jgi:hypothetical protein